MDGVVAEPGDKIFSNGEDAAKWLAAMRNVSDIDPETCESPKCITSYKRIEKLRKDKAIDVLVVKLKNPVNLRNARVMQRQFIASYLNGGRCDKIKDAALVAFHAEGGEKLRFSFVYKDYIFKDESVQSTLPEPKRSSFLVANAN